MEQRKNSFVRTIVHFCVGLFGVGIIIIIHELGHFITAHIFGVPTPLFSLGFGPGLLQLPTQLTTFQIAVVPLGGYVTLDEAVFEAQSYMVKMIIMFSGIAMNFISAFVVLAVLAYKKNTTIKHQLSFTYGTIGSYVWKGSMSRKPHPQKKSSVILGPIGIIKLLGQSVDRGIDSFLYVFAFLHLGIGKMNLFIPLPFFDGGKMLYLTLEQFRIFNSTFANLIFITLAAIALLFINRLLYKKKKINQDPVIDLETDD